MGYQIVTLSVIHSASIVSNCKQITHLMAIKLTTRINMYFTSSAYRDRKEPFQVFLTAIPIALKISRSAHMAQAVKIVRKHFAEKLACISLHLVVLFVFLWISNWGVIDFYAWIIDLKMSIRLILDSPNLSELKFRNFLTPISFLGWQSRKIGGFSIHS